MSKLNLKQVSLEDQSTIIKELKTIYNQGGDEIPEFGPKYVIREVLCDCLPSRVDPELRAVFMNLGKKGKDELVRQAMGWRE